MGMMRVSSRSRIKCKLFWILEKVRKKCWYLFYQRAFLSISVKEIWLPNALRWVFRTKMYGEATLHESCPESLYLECVHSGRKIKRFCRCQRASVLIMTRWPSSFPGSLKAVERWVTCLSSVTLPFCSLKQTGSAPLVSHPAGIEFRGFIRIDIPIYATDNGVRWGDVLSFFFTGAQRKG